MLNCLITYIHFYLCVLFPFTCSTFNLSSHNFVCFLFRSFLPRSHENVTFNYCLPQHPTVLPRCCHVQIYSLLLHTHSQRQYPIKGIRNPSASLTASNKLFTSMLTRHKEHELVSHCAKHYATNQQPL